MPILSAALIRQIAAGSGFTDDPGAPDLTIATAIALAESGGNTDAINSKNTNKSIDYGVWQINSVHANLLAGKNWRDPHLNGVMAFRVFADAGYRWIPWSTFNSGAYKRFMSTAGNAAIRGMWTTLAAGDTLSHVAQVAYSDGARWPLIWHAPENAALVAHRLVPEHLQPGDRVWVPQP